MTELLPGVRVVYDFLDQRHGTDSAVVLSAPGQNFTSADFGYVGTASVDSVVFSDVNGDGTQGTGEPGIGGVTATLDFAGNDGVFGTADDVTSVTSTDATGAFHFAGLPVDGTNPANNYRLTLSGLPAVYTAETVDADGTATPGTATFTLGPTQDRTDVGFGYRGTASVGNFVW
jgi:hypothetical protein